MARVGMMQQCTIDSFIPKVNVSIEKLKELDYTKDYQGNDLTDEIKS